MAFDIHSEIAREGDRSVAGVNQAGQHIVKRTLLQSASAAKVGATAGWTVRGATDTNLATLAALLQSGSTLVFGIDGLNVGDTITGFGLIGQIESGGGTVTLDADLRKLTSATAGHSSTSVGTITQISATADTKLGASSTTGLKTGLEEKVASDETFYVVITGITGAASTDIEMQGVKVLLNGAS